METNSREAAQTKGATLLTATGIGAAFGVAACCALPILLTTVGLSAAWLGGVAVAAAPYRTVLLWLSAISLAGGALLLLLAQRSARSCGTERACSPPWLRLVLLGGLLAGATLLWLGYSYV